MPTGTCKSPEHYGPSAGPPFAFLGALLLGALVLFRWHSVVLTLVVVVVLIVALGFVTMLVHQAHPARRASEHAQLVLPAPRAQLPASPRVQVAVTQVVKVTNHLPLERRSTTLQAEVAALRAQLAQVAAVQPAEQHLHLHGVTPEQIAAAARLADPVPGTLPAAIETGQPSTERTPR